MEILELSLEELVALFNPANANSLTPEQIQAMQHLTVDQIKALAEAYPNQPRGNAYLVLGDLSKKDKQLFPRSTWGNLYNLVKNHKKPNFYAAGFSSNYLKNPLVSRKIEMTPVQDLTKDQVNDEIKTIPIQSAKPTDSNAPEAPVAPNAENSPIAPDSVVPGANDQPVNPEVTDEANLSENNASEEVVNESQLEALANEDKNLVSEGDQANAENTSDSSNLNEADQTAPAPTKPSGRRR